jgi:MHS family proline/betaine transporter-like MFS transporter
MPLTVPLFCNAPHSGATPPAAVCTWLKARLPGVYLRTLSTNQSFAIPAASRGTLTRTVLAGAIGNVLEWCDFGLFGYFAPVIAYQFMPAENKLASLVGTFGVFAMGFVMRPLGGVVFGIIGDRLGRKRALELSILLMASSTTLLGLLPTYATIGVVAPLLLTLIRIAQGVSVGGEYIGSMSFLAEHSPPNRRAFFGSWSAFSVILGMLLGSGIAALFSLLLTQRQMADWGWRGPFLASALMGLFAFWLRLDVEESPSFMKMKKPGQLADNPLRETLRHDRGAIATALGLVSLMSVAFYIPFIWLPTWLAHITEPARSADLALSATTMALLALLILTPLTALVSDRVGREPIFLASALGFALLSYPLFVGMRSGTFNSALLASLLFAVCSSLSVGCMAATLVELFPTRTRYTGVAIGYNLGQGLLGGTAPLVATALIHLSDNVLAPAYYLIASGIVAGIACLFIKPRHNVPLDELEDMVR